MAQYFTDFSEYTTGQQPSDWTAQWDTGPWALTVVDDAGATGGKYAEFSGTGSGAAGGFTWDEIDGDAGRDNYEILIRFRFPDAGGSQEKIIPVGRLQPSPTREAYGHTHQFDNRYLTHEKWVADSYALIDNYIGPYGGTANQWYWMRCRMNGSTMQTRFWADGSAEPASWTVEDTDTDITAAGSVGIVSYALDMFSHVDVFAVGTNGDTAAAFDTSGSYLEVTFDATQVPSTLTNYPAYIDLADVADARFWATVAADGGNIRFTDGSETPLPFEIVSIDTVAETGEIHVKVPSLDGAVNTVIRMYYDTGLSALAATEPEGRNAVWSDYAGVWHFSEDPSTGIIDATGQGATLTQRSGSSMDSADVVSGSIGDAVDMDGVDDRLSTPYAARFAPVQGEITYWVNRDNVNQKSYAEHVLMGEWDNGSPYLWAFEHSSTSDSNFRFSANDGGAKRTPAGELTNPNQWYHVRGVIDGSGAGIIELLVDNVSVGSAAFLSFDADQPALTVGAYGDPQTSGGEFDGKFDELRIRSSLTTADWRTAEYNNQTSPSTFYTISAPDPFDMTGDYLEVDFQASQVSSTLTDYPAFIDLGDVADANFWATVAADGGNIRFTTAAEDLIPFEIVSIDTAAQTGEIHVKVPSLSGSVNTTVRMYYNTGLSALAATDPNGRDAVWSAYEAVYHFADDPSGGTLTDATGKGNDGTINGAMTAGDLVSGLMGSAYDFDGADDYIQTPLGWAGFSNLTVQSLFRAKTGSFTQLGIMIWIGNALGNGGGGEQEVDLGWGAETWTGGDNTIYGHFEAEGGGGLQAADLNLKVENFTDDVNFQHVVWRVADPFGATPSGNLFHNGVNAASDTATSAIPTVNWDTNMRIGRPGTNVRYTNSVIDEIRVSNASLSDDWIATEENNHRSASTFYTIAAPSTSTYTLTAQTGNFTLTGIDATLTYNSLTNYTLTAETGSFSLIGQDAGLLRGYLLQAEQATFTLTGQQAGLLAAYTLTAQTGTFNLTGIDAGLLAARRLEAQQASFSLTGQDATLTYTPATGYILTAETGVFSLTGSDAELLRALRMVAETGSFSLSGQTADLLAARRLAAEQANFVLTGFDADIRYQVGYTLVAETGTFTATGQDAGILYNRVLVADPATFTLTGNDATLTTGLFVASPDIITLTSTMTAELALQSEISETFTTNSPMSP